MEEEKDIRSSFTHPEIFPITLSHTEFPCSETMKNDSGMVFGFTVIPFLSNSDSSNLKKDIPKTPSATKVARCMNCAAYINPFCEASTLKWICSICGTRNVFPKSMLRYRQQDMNALPEMQNLMVDYPFPLSGDEFDTAQEKFSCPASSRPLVHVFLVQESMSLDCIQATIQALETMSNSMHPDIEIIFLTFSNRIGVYRLLGQSSKAVCVQYIHFVNSSSNPSDPSMILEAQENSTYLRTTSTNTQSTASSSQIHPMLSLNDAVIFGETSLPIGVCRKNLLYGLSSLHDASPSASSSPGAICGPLVMIGPVLEEVVSWICGNGDENGSGSGNASTPHPPVQHHESNTIGGGLIGLLAGLGITSPPPETPPSESSDLYKGWNIGTSPHRNNSGIDFCTGVELHLIISTPQDLCYGSHPSVSPVGSLSNDWIQGIALKCATKGIGVNIWGLADYESSMIGLSELKPLVELTGGKLSRFVLGTNPAAERTRFATELTRVVTSQVASKCLMKLRTSSLVNDKFSRMLGYGIQDDSMPGIFKIASCRSSNTFGYFLQFQNEFPDNFEDTRSSKISSSLIIQIAFSYNTLVELEESRSRKSSRSESFSDPSEFETREKNSRSNSSEDIFPNMNQSRVNLSFSVDKDEEEVGSQEMETTQLKEVCDGLNLSSAYEEYSLHRAKKIQKNFKMEKSTTKYNNKNRLIAVRRLRVITCMIETTPKVPRLLRYVHVPTMLLIILRDSLIQKDIPTSLNILQSHSFNILTSVCQMIYLHRFQDSRTENNSQFDAISQDMALQIIRETFQIPQISRFLQLYFAALHLFNSSTETSTQEARADIFTELVALLMTSDYYTAEKLLYPEFREIRSDMTVNCDHQLRLRRESVTTSGKGLYLLDSIRQIILYRPILSSSSEPLSPAYKSDDQNLPSPEKYLVDPTDNPILRNSSWIVNDLARRLKINPFTPKISFAEAGKLSSYSFSELLLEDCSSLPGGFQGFLDRLVLDLSERLVTVPSL